MVAVVSLANVNGSYIGRLAPSPTGLLHLGHARTFWIAYERARAAGGMLWLRDEDLDPQRSRGDFAEAMREDLRWLGIAWQDEARQSERLGLYRAAMERLLVGGYVYPCFCSRRDLQLAVQAPHEEDDEPVYRGTCRPGGLDVVAGPGSGFPAGMTERKATATAEAEATATAFTLRAQSEGHAKGAKVSGAGLAEGTNYRFRVGDGDVVGFDDLQAGAQAFRAGSDVGADFGDFVVWRKDGLPSYQLACVVDDAAMGITEVVRGRDLLKSTARQILLQRVLGLASPAYLHCDLMRDADGVRLAKRHDALSLRAMREAGLTPEDVRARF